MPTTVWRGWPGRDSVATGKNHMHSILQKLPVSRRGQASPRLRGSHAA